MTEIVTIGGTVSRDAMNVYISVARSTLSLGAVTWVLGNELPPIRTVCVRRIIVVRGFSHCINIAETTEQKIETALYSEDNAAAFRGWRR